MRKIAVVALALTLAVSLAARAQESVPPMSMLLAGDPTLAKVSSHLLVARWAARQGITLEELDEGKAFRRGKLIEERPRVDIRLTELNPGIVAHLAALGVEIERAHFKYARVDARLGLELLAEVAALPEVTAIHPQFPPIRMTGAVTSQGDVSINAAAARTLLGVDGSGVTVGILSDSFNATLGGTLTPGVCTCAAPGSSCTDTVDGMPNQVTGGTGDLPDTIPILDDCTAPGAVPGDPCFGLSDEGAAIGELMFDLAPGADFMFHSAFNSEADFAGGITELTNCGAEVIVDDVFYPQEPMFQDGVVAQAAQDAVDDDIPYFSAAGNQATYGIDDFYLDSAASDDTSDPPTGDDFHDFGGGDTAAAVTIPEDCSVTFVLQWNDPFSGVLGAGASSDLDLYFCFPTPALADCFLFSKTRQGCGVQPAPPIGDPLEILGIIATGGPATGFLRVEHHCGDQDEHFRVATFPGAGCGFPGAYDFEDGFDLVAGLPVVDPTETPIYTDAQIYGHPAAAGVVAVAAADYREIDSGGTFQGDPMIKDVQPFSSLGGDLPFYFNGSGSPLGPVSGSPLGPIGSGPPGALGPTAPETRFKPDITAPDGTNNTFFGIDVEPDGFPNFFGTSAAAPHAAAVAALMQELGNLTPAGLTQVIQQSALDFEAPDTDDLSGFGLMDALKGIGTTVPSNPSCFIDDLELEGKPNTGDQTFHTCNSLTVGKGDFSDVIGNANDIIFADGFESGDTSVWTN